MRILIDISHPAHVHLFKHFAWEMQNKGHEVFFTCREKEFEIYLLEKYKFKYKSFGKKYSSQIAKIWGMFEFDIKEFLAGLKFKPDIFLSHGSIYASHAAFFLNKPHIALEDTGNMEQIRLYSPFTKVILTPDSLKMFLNTKQINYYGYHELAYLHPNKFSPNKDKVYDFLQIKEKDKYIIFRFVAWNASHDIYQKGISGYLRDSIIKKLLVKGYKIFISSENSLPYELEKFRIKISPEDIHNILYFSELFIGEGATMANESAILGTPAIYVNTRKACIGDLEDYNLLFHFRTSNGLINKVNELISMSNLKLEWQKRRERMLKDKIDVTAFLVWFVENYPRSVRIMRENPEYQFRFR